MEEKIKLEENLVMHKFYKMDTMEEYKKLARQYLNKENLTEKELQDLSYDYDFVVYFNNNQTTSEDLSKIIYKDTFDIVESRENEHFENDSSEWKARIKNLFDFDGNQSSYVYVLKEKDIPVAFALFSCMDEEAKRWNLELVYSHSAKSNKGFAKTLLKGCFKDLNKEHQKEVIAVVEKTNQNSIYLHEQLANEFNCGKYVEEKTNNIVYEFNISNLQKKEELSL